MTTANHWTSFGLVPNFYFCNLAEQTIWVSYTVYIYALAILKGFSKQTHRWLFRNINIIFPPPVDQHHVNTGARYLLPSQRQQRPEDSNTGWTQTRLNVLAMFSTKITHHWLHMTKEERLRSDDDHCRHWQLLSFHDYQRLIWVQRQETTTWISKSGSWRILRLFLWIPRQLDDVKLLKFVIVKLGQNILGQLFIYFSVTC